MTTPSPQAVALVEADMIDLCTIRAPGRSTYDPDTNELVAAGGGVVYVGSCNVAALTTRGDEVEDRGSEAESSSDYQVSVPLSAPPIPEGHHLTVDASRDPYLVGRTLFVRKVRLGTRASRRILRCELIGVVPR